MQVLAKIFTTEQFSFDGKKYVKIKGIMNEKELFEQTVREELVPDGLEGKEAVLEFEIGVSKFKPYLRLKRIVID